MSFARPSRLDFQQVLQNSYDEGSLALRVKGNFQLEGGTTQLLVSHEEDSIKLGDGIKLVGTTEVDSKVGLNVSVLGGNFTPSGLSTAIKCQRITVTDTPTKIPATALLKRNSISVRILGADTVYIGDSLVSAATGYPKFQNEEIIMDVTDKAEVALWAVCAAGRTCEVACLELA